MSTQSIHGKTQSTDSLSKRVYRSNENISIYFDSSLDRDLAEVAGEQVLYPNPSTIGESHAGSQIHLKGTRTAHGSLNTLSIPQKPARAVVRSRDDIEILELTNSSTHANWTDHRVTKALNVPSSFMPQKTSPGFTWETRNLQNGGNAMPPPVIKKSGSMDCEPKLFDLTTLTAVVTQPPKQVTTFPSRPFITKRESRQPTSLHHGQHALPPPPASVEPYRHDFEPIPLFLSAEAEEYWKVFGPVDPVILGDIILHVEGPQKWLTACFAVAHPYAHELMRQLDALSTEIASVLCRYSLPYKSVFQPDYRVGVSYSVEWQDRFDRFREHGWSDDWDSRVKKLCLLSDEYQVTTDMLYGHWTDVQFVPKNAWDRLKRLDMLRKALQDNMPSMPELIEHVAILHRDKEQRREEREKERERLRERELETDYKTEQDRRETANTKSLGRSRFWHSCFKVRSSKGHKRSQDTRSLSNDIYDALAGWKQDCLAFFDSLAHLRTYGTQKAAYVIVSCLSALATAAMALSVWRCPPAAALSISITIDSNFWSTCSQMFTGLGGLYCLIIPILQHTDLDVSTPRLFKGLLVLSFVAAIVAVIVYHFQTQVSLVVALVSGLAGLLATLMVIKDAGNTIKVQNNTIDEQAFNVMILEDEVMRLRNR